MNRRNQTKFVLIGLLAGVACGSAAPVQADDDTDVLKQQLREIEHVIRSDSERAQRLEAEAAEQRRQLGVLRAEMQAAARAVQAHEAAVTRLERERAALDTEISVKRKRLAERRGELGTTLAALQRIALRPPAALLVAPGDPNDIVRSGLLIRTAIPRIEARAEALRADLAALAELDRDLADNGRDLEAAGALLLAERARLSGLVADKNALLDETQAEQGAATARVEELTKKSRNIAELLEQLLRQRQKPAVVPLPRPDTPPRKAAAIAPAPDPSGPSISHAEGRLTPPAEGELVVAFGDRNEFGTEARGTTWRTRWGASVVAPWDGRVVFAGPFRQFGPILIIDHGEGYHSLIAGLGRTDARIGQWVLAGEPVGAASDANSVQDARNGRNGGGGPSQGSTSSTTGPTVYVEFRRNGQPINPLPWLAASIDRTDG